MRLTLRTLLAHMDGLLPSDDAQEIGKKIQESEFASGLNLRIRDCMRRLRLGAPSINERGSGLDPNTVAEYLEYRLSDARVQDFERVCLESDVHLAEVASCHQILAAILGEPAEIDPASCRRMHQIPALLAAGASQGAGEVDAPPVVAPPSGPHFDNEFESQQAVRPCPPAPPMASRAVGRGSAASAPWLRWLWAGMGLIVVVAAAAVLTAVQFRPESPLAKLFSRAPASDDSQDGIDDESSPDAGKKAVENGGKPDGGAGGFDDGARPRPARPRRGESEVEPARIIPIDDGSPSPRGSAAGKPPAAATKRAPVSAEREPKESAAKSKAGSNGGSSDAAAEAGIPPAPPSNPRVAAQFTGRGQVALRIEPRDGQGYRLSDLRLLQPGDAVVSLPGFRPEFMLPGKLRVTLIDGSAMTLLPPGADGFVGIALERGRLLARPESPEGASFYFRAQETVGRVTLWEESIAAIEVARAENPGVDPETQPGPLVADLYVLTGKASWRLANDPKARELKAPVRLSLSDRPGELAPLQQRPRWTDEDSVDPLEQRAAVAFERGLPPDKPVGLRLRELADHRQKEVRWLAHRSMALTGDVEPLVEALNSVEQRLAWSDFIAELRAMVAAGPQSAAAVRTAMEKVYGPRGADLYPLLWKYGPQPPSGESLSELIGALEHSVLAFRVLAFWNLKTLTGQTYSYHPEDTPQRRQAALQRWRDRTSVKPPAKPSAKPRPGARDDAPTPPKTAERTDAARPRAEEPDAKGVDY
jgi:hypothetical protein